MNELAIRKYVRLVLERAITVSPDQLLLKINARNGGSIPADELTSEETTVAMSLVKCDLLHHVPAGHGISNVGGMRGFYGDNMTVTGGRNEPTPVDPKVAHRYPERYVVTSGGSHSTDTFKSDTLRDELPRRRR